MDQAIRDIPATARHAIGELARRTGVKATTIRWYEQEGLLPPPARSEGGHRLYTEDHLRRLGFIRHARELGFGMPAIRALLGLAGRPREDCTAAHALARAQIAEIDSRLRRLEALRAELVGMAEACAGGAAQDCRILETLADFDHGHCRHHDHEAAP
ncbi:MAG TPA: helix-turn-helix domain-containing protein [Roseomonas sp.]|nr:helix-turn-helix domain-containing protein [Roseomonas sp.]